jgi:putative flippase GtrA
MTAARWARFGAVGLGGAAVQAVAFACLLRGLHLPGAPSAAMAVEAALLHNFFWHERFTWGDRPAADLRRRALRLWRFHVTNGVVSIAGNAALAWCLVDRLGMPALPAAAIAIAACAPLNFLAADRWVYRRS